MFIDIFGAVSSLFLGIVFLWFSLAVTFEHFPPPKRLREIEENYKQEQQKLKSQIEDKDKELQEQKKSYEEKLCEKEAIISKHEKEIECLEKSNNALYAETVLSDKKLLETEKELQKRDVLDKQYSNLPSRIELTKELWQELEKISKLENERLINFDSDFRSIVSKTMDYDYVKKGLTKGRLINAFKENNAILNLKNFNRVLLSVAIGSQKLNTENTYIVNFEKGKWQCGCRDFERNGPKFPCKHVLYFMYSIGLLCTEPSVHKKVAEQLQELQKLKQKKKTAEREECN